ncbi:TonB family protein [Oscillatoria sp. CS-180]|uniref:energy transducer TonB family protein n=1 Tax=Oscillatoria sp. CS-180 TaxID=3021720 RepID=UPI00232AC9C9|nr:TonB family protein [Oscillatoria sp. CS-180]MDB9529319.1 TonB family protein [Oscillatoria sp. CS-180]
MGFSEPSSEGRRRELRILGRVLIGASIAAIAMHLSSAPLVVRMVSGLFSDLDVEVAEEPIEIIVVDEDIPDIEEENITPPPPSEEATETEPAASAPEESAPPLRTTDSAFPTPPTADSIDTVPTESVIASEEGIDGGEGGEGSADTIGLISGDGSTDGDLTAPVGLPNVARSEPEPPPVNRQPVQEIARARPPAARLVSCDPCSSPDYPLSEQREQIEGQPIINVIFDQNGNVVEAVIEKSSGNTAFDQAALEEARENWQFQDPYSLGGQVSVEVTFVIEGSDQFDAATDAGEREALELPVQQSIVPVNPAATGTAPTVEAPETTPTVTPESLDTQPEAESSDAPASDEPTSEDNPSLPAESPSDSPAEENRPIPSSATESENPSPAVERDRPSPPPTGETLGSPTPMPAPEPAPATPEPATPVPEAEAVPVPVPQPAPEPEPISEPTEE